MKTLFILFAILSPISVATAEDEIYFVDRRSFRSSPTSACVHIFKDTNYLKSSCKSIGFQNSRKSKSGLTEYQDFIYFFKIDENSLANRNTLLFITSYKSSNKSLSLSAFQDLNDLNSLVVEQNIKTSLADQKSKLQLEIDSLKILRTKIRSQFESSLFDVKQEKTDGAELNEIIEMVRKVHKIKLLDDELNYSTEKNQQIIDFSDTNLKKFNSDKAKLSNILKSTIESSLGSN